MTGFDTEAVLVAFGYAGVFILMVANGFASFPSSQILYIIAGYFISTGDFGWLPISFVGALGNSIGNILLYEVARRKGIEYILRYRIFPEREVRKVEIAFQKKGAWFLFIGKLLPAIKVFVPIPAGIAKMHRGLFAGIIFASSYIWTLPFLAIGFYFGKGSDVFGKYAIILAIIAFAVLAFFYKYMNSEKVVKEIEGV